MKTLSKLEIDVGMSAKKLTANIILNGKLLKGLPEITNKTIISALTYLYSKLCGRSYPVQ